MIWYRLKRKVPREPESWWRNPDERLYFKKDGSGGHVGTFYQTRETAERALKSVYKPEDYEIVAFEMREVDE